MTNKLNVIDLFAGCGGLADGFEQTNLYNNLACVEWEGQPCNTLIQRLKDKWEVEDATEKVLRFDIQRTEELINGWKDDKKYGSHIGLNKIIGEDNIVDLVIGGPPCQAYSVAGRIRDSNGMHDDYRNFLFESYLKVVDSFRPKAFVFENVPGMLSAKPGGVSIIDRITAAFLEIGYEILTNLKEHSLIDCTEYGVPQARKRLIIVGVNTEKIKVESQLALLDFYKTILPKYRSDRKFNVRDAILDLPKIIPVIEEVNGHEKKRSHSLKKSDTLIANHFPRVHNKRDINIFRLLATDIELGINKYLKSEALIELYFQETGKRSNVHKYHVLRWDKPSNTIPAHLYKDGLRHIHPDPNQARTITIREAARLQSFDDDFIFIGSATDQYKMIGNAVPPLFAKAIGYAINDFIEKYF